MELKELQLDAYTQAVERGLYKDSPTKNKLLWHIREEATEAVRAWQRYRDVKTHYECNSRTITDCMPTNFDCSRCKQRRNEGVNQELADVIIMTLSACEHLGIDIEAAIKEKMAYNAIRER